MSCLNPSTDKSLIRSSQMEDEPSNCHETAPKGDENAVPVLSKSARKKLLKKQWQESRKAERKAAEKDRKRQDLDRRRREWEETLAAAATEDEKARMIESRREVRKERMGQRTEEREARNRRLRAAAETGQKVVIDLEFADLMAANEIHSLVKQIMYCYAGNGRSATPAHLWLTGCRGEIGSQLQRISGFDKWIIEKEDKSYLEVLQGNKENLVYLTADAENVLDELDTKKVYIVGGLVDRNRWKGLTLKKAKDQGIQSAKLPIATYLKMSSSQVLTVNQVVEILLNYLETRDWKNAFFQVIPPRKRGEAETGNEEAEDKAEEDSAEIIKEDDEIGWEEEEEGITPKKHCIRGDDNKVFGNEKSSVFSDAVSRDPEADVGDTEGKRHIEVATADNGVTLYDRTHRHEPAVNTIGDYDKRINANMLKLDVESERRLNHEDTLPRESKISVEADPSHYTHSPGHWNDSDTKDFFKNVQSEDELVETRCLLPDDIQVVQNEADTCAEKSIAAIEVLGTRMNCMDGAFQNVKDICIDEGVHSVKKVLTESTADQQSLYKFKQNDNHDRRHDVMDSTSEEHDICHVSYGMMSSSVKELRVFVVDKEGTKHCSFDDSLADGYELDNVALSVKTTSEKQFPALQKVVTDQWQVDPLNSVITGDKKQLDQGTLEVRVSTDEKDSLHAIEDPIQHNGKKKTSANKAVEGGVITFNFDSGEETVSGKDEHKECSDNHQSGQLLCVPKREEETVDGATAPARNSFVHHGCEDLNIYGPAALSGPLASSGYIPYSGSTSLRSDSSTTSTRSFAFPVLQSEWNSSPVRMAKADRRRLRKHRGWRVGLLCCKF